MAALGTYLTLELDGDVIAETTELSIKIEADALESTTKDSGINATFIAGKYKAGLAGTFLLATNGANFDTLYTLINTATSMDVVVYYNGSAILNGTGIMKQLSETGANSDTLVTGKYGIRFHITDVGENVEIITEDGFTIITESGETIITE